MDILEIHGNFIRKLANKNRKIEECLRRFQLLSEDNDKVDYAEDLLRSFGEIPGIDEKVVKRLSKNNADSENFRKEGNKHFSLKNKDYFKAIELYNKSICFAPTGSENLGIGYANRSAIFLEWKKYEECLESIKNARLSNYPENLLHKLDKREAQCLEAMRNNPKENEESVEFELSHEKHPQVPFISKCLDIKKYEKFGRYIYTKEDLVPGQLISIEEPFCTALYPAYKYIRCANCNIENNCNLIPCPNCTSAMFCSEKCMEEGHKSFHKYECPIIDALLQLFIKELTGIRVPLVALQYFENAQEMMNFCNAPENQNKDAFSIDYTSFNQKEYYRAIHGLETNQEKAAVYDISLTAVACAVLRYYMLEDTPLREIFNTEDTKRFFTNLLFKHLQIGLTNGCGIYYVQPKSKNEAYDCFASAVYGFGSLFSHSCAPNVFTINKNAKLYTFVLRPIPENGVLYGNYGPHFATQPRFLRQVHLKTIYRFDCQCEACVYDYSQSDATKEAPISMLPVTAHDSKMLSLCDKKFAKENYTRYISFLRQFAEYYPCFQSISAEEALKIALHILMDAVPLKRKI